MTENHDEMFILLGYCEPERLRPIFIFQHLLHNVDFQLDLIPGIYNVLIETGLIQDPGTICLVVTVGARKRVTIVNHVDSATMQFTREEVFELFCKALTLKRRSREILTVGYRNCGGEYFYTKFGSAPDHSDIKTFSRDEMDEIGEVFYCETSKPISRSF